MFSFRNVCLSPNDAFNVTFIKGVCSFRLRKLPNWFRFYTILNFLVIFVTLTYTFFSRSVFASSKFFLKKCFIIFYTQFPPLSILFSFGIYLLRCSFSAFLFGFVFICWFVNKIRQSIVFDGIKCVLCFLPSTLSLYLFW